MTGPQRARERSDGPGGGLGGGPRRGPGVCGSDAGPGPAGSGLAPGGAAIRAVLASANPHKAAEIAAIVADEAGDLLHLVPRPVDVPDVEETGDTFEANARLKAEALVAATGMPALADDSGLQVDALGGSPGVWSARYAGERATDEQNVAKLLADLQAVGATDPGQRRARFRAVVVLAFPDGDEIVASGTCEGTVLPAPRGADGFGYDPVFAPDGADGRSFAELSGADKHARSHRGRALRALAVALRRGGALGD